MSAGATVADEPCNPRDDERRELRFTLEIVTDLGEGDEAKPSVEYVTDWLNDNGYGYVVVEQPEVRRG